MLELFPEIASVEDGELAIGGVLVSHLAADFGTPLVVYCERTIRAQARAYRAAEPGERIVFHGNNKSDDELRAAARVGALVVLDAVDEVERAAAAAVRRVL